MTSSAWRTATAAELRCRRARSRRGLHAGPADDAVPFSPRTLPLKGLHMILVTGGAGFIGANFVLDWLAQSDEALINLDKLTYAGNRENLASLADDPRHIFVHGDIGDSQLTSQPAGAIPAAGDRQLCRRIARRSLDPWSRGLHPDQHRRQLPPARSDARLLGTLADEARQRFRFLHVSTDEVYGSLASDEPAFSETTPTNRTAPTRRARRRATIWCAPTTTPTACRC
jgi:hypothetical protein